MTRTGFRRLRWTLTVPFLAVAMSVGAVGPAAQPAGATDPEPFVTFVDSAAAGSGTGWLRAGAPDGTGSVPLTPADYHAWDVDVSQDGSAWVAGLGHPDRVASAWDRSYGLVLVRRVGGVTTTTLLASSWDDAVITSDGSAVWWLGSGSLWRWSEGEIDLAGASGAFQPPSGWRVVDMQLADDDHTLAVSYEPLSGIGARVLAADVGVGTAMPYVLHRSSTRRPSYGQMYWAYGSLLFAYTDGSSSTWYGATASSTGGTVSLVGEPSASALAEVYRIRQLGGWTGNWWGWRDVGSVTQYASVPGDFGTATWSDRVDGPTSWDYVPSLGQPPAMTTPVNRPPTYSHLDLSASSTRYGRRVVYAAWADYLVANPWLSLSEHGAEVDRGILQMSTNAGSTWTTVGWTSWGNPVPWPPDTRYSGSGYTPVLTRNTWFRWVYPGDLLTRSSTSATSRVVVIPTTTVAKARSASGRTKVYGKVTRIAGSIQLWRWTGSRWVRTATASISRNGAYSFGYRNLRRGTYKVVVPATTYWGASVRRFRI
jgi:hypothetical protein